MKSLADALPPEIARQIDPDWRKNEAAYWAVRDQLLSQYQGQWIGFADGAVIASGTSPVAVFHAAEATGRNPFVTCVGREDEPVRMRRVSFAYDGSYPGEPLPILTLEFRPVSGSPGVTLDRVIADTGADASALPWADCQGLQLTAAQGRPGWMGGVAGGTAPTLHFRVWVYLDGQEYPCRLQADFVGNERILGRDVLNRLETLFRGPAGEVVVNSLQLDQDLSLLNRAADVGIDLGDLAGGGCRDHGLHFHRFEDHQDIIDLDGLPDLDRDAGDHAREGTAADLALVGHGSTAGLHRGRGAGSGRGNAGLTGGGNVAGVRLLRLEDLDLGLVHPAVDGDLQFQSRLLV